MERDVAKRMEQSILEGRFEKEYPLMNKIFEKMREEEELYESERKGRTVQRHI